MSSASSNPTGRWSRNRWESIILIMVLVVMSLQISMRFGGGLPDWDASADANESHSKNLPQFLERFQSRPGYEPSMPESLWAGQENPFYTDRFTPPPKPPPAPAPTTRELSVTFQGWFESSQGEVQAFMSLDDKQVKGAAGSQVGSDLIIESIESKQLILKSSDGVKHSIPFSQPTKIVIPLP